MSDPASKRLRHYSDFRIRNAKLSNKGTRNVGIYAISLGKFLNVWVYACVKELTNIMSEDSIVSFYLASCSALFPEAFFTSSLMFGTDMIITAARENPSITLSNI